MLNKIVVFSLILVTTSGTVRADEYAELIAYRDSLKSQIQDVKSELTRCEKSLKGWKTATIIGGIGAVASGIGIIAQNQQIKENKKVLNEMSADAKEATEFLDMTKGF